MNNAASGSALGLHRVVDPAGALPQAAAALDPDPTLRPDEVRLRVERLNLDAASFRQLWTDHEGDGSAVRAQVLETVRTRGKMHNAVTGSGGMLIGVVEEVGPESPLGLHVGERVASLVSLTLTPLRITDELRSWDGCSEQVPAEGSAILFARSIAAVLPDDLPENLSMAVLDVCGAPALTARVLASYVEQRAAVTGARPPTVVVIGAAGKSGSLALAAARRAGARPIAGVVPVQLEADLLTEAALADHVLLADARNPVAVAATLERALGSAADVTVVCVDVAGCEHGAILCTAAGGTVIFFSMATSFSAAALGAEGLAADVTMLIGNGYVPGHAAYAFDLLRSDPRLRRLFEQRLTRP